MIVSNIQYKNNKASTWSIELPVHGNGSQVFQHSEPLQCYYYFEWTNTDSYMRIEALWRKGIPKFLQARTGKSKYINTQRRLWSHISASSHQPCSAISCLYTAKVSEKNFSLRYCDLDKGGVSTIIFCRASICYILLSLFLNQ